MLHGTASLRHVLLDRKTNSPEKAAGIRQRTVWKWALEDAVRLRQCEGRFARIGIFSDRTKGEAEFRDHFWIDLKAI